MTSTDPIDPVAFRAFEHAGWQRAAEHYPDAFGSLTSQTIASLLDAVRLEPGTKLLDVASGPGFVAAAAAERGAIVVGVDFSPAMVDYARRRHPTLTFMEGDAEKLRLPDRNFDAVVMNFGLLHLARPEAAVSEAFRVLRTGGRYSFTVWAKPEVAAGFGIVLRAIETHGTIDVGLPIGPAFFRFSDPGECRRCLLEAGFDHVEVRELPLAWRLASADSLFDAMSRGAVRTTALLYGQTPENLSAIREAIRTTVRQYARGDAIVVPMGAVIASAIKS